MNETPAAAREDTPAGEILTFERLLSVHAGDGLRLARFLGLLPEDAADAVQEASILAWRYRKSRRGEFNPWFLTIVRRVARRRRETWTLMPWFWEPRSGHVEVDFLGGSEIARAMSVLPARQRAAVWLRYGRDLTHSDIGRILGVSESAAKMLVVRARSTLRAQLAASGPGTSS